MRWFFLFLLVLNVFYFVWHQQQAPLRAKEIAPLNLYRSEQKNIRLLSESPEAAAKRPSNSAVVPPGVCLFFGPLRDEGRAKALEQRFTTLDIRVSRQKVDSGGGTDYWVYLSPLASRQAALLQLRELQARNIDSYIITEGDLANGISLGFLQSRDSADGVVERLKAAGYDAQVRELSRSQHDFWVQIAPESRRLADESLVRQLVADFPELQQQTLPCKGVASEN